MEYKIIIYNKTTGNKEQIIAKNEVMYFNWLYSIVSTFKHFKHTIKLGKRKTKFIYKEGE